MKHEFYTGLSVAIMGIYAVKKLGLPQSNFLDDEVAVIEMSHPCLAPHLIFHTFPLEIRR
jgi:hypothetical protein